MSKTHSSDEGLVLRRAHERIVEVIESSQRTPVSTVEYDSSRGMGIISEWPFSRSFRQDRPLSTPSLIHVGVLPRCSPSR